MEVDAPPSMGHPGSWTHHVAVCLAIVISALAAINIYQAVIGFRRIQQGLSSIPSAPGARGLLGHVGILLSCTPWDYMTRCVLEAPPLVKVCTQESGITSLNTYSFVFVNSSREMEGNCYCNSVEVEAVPAAPGTCPMQNHSFGGLRVSVQLHLSVVSRKMPGHLMCAYAVGSSVWHSGSSLWLGPQRA
jgi:hypothetical protein